MFSLVGPIMPNGLSNCHEFAKKTKVEDEFWVELLLRLAAQ